MFNLKYPTEQNEPPHPRQAPQSGTLPTGTLPTMYDLPSESIENPGLPDEFHYLQPRLLDATCDSPCCSPEQTFKGMDINLYYDVEHLSWYKRPDWFLVKGTNRLYENRDLRLSYVMWQEKVAPLIVVEFLSPGTAAEDLGAQVKDEAQLDEALDGSADGIAEEDATEEPLREKPPRKWEVYEQILQVPYYVVFSRYSNQMRMFRLQANGYQEVDLDAEQPRIWIPALELGLGLWYGKFEGIERLWLRWYDATGNWVLTAVEREHLRAEQEKQRAERAEQLLEAERLEKKRLLERLRQLEGI